MIKIKQKIIFLFLIFFSIYCALTIGLAWDEEFLKIQGKTTLNYLLSLGKIDEDLFRREYYSPIYYSIKYLFVQIFPAKYQIEASYLINLIFSFCTLVGIKKLSKELFNNKVGTIVFLVLFFYPIFFGHMAFNSKDTIIAFSHVWVFYFFIRYIKNQHIKEKADSSINLIAILCALGTGINLFFLGSLLPVFLFILFDIFFIKKFACKPFDKKKLLIDFFKGFIIFYILLVLFWIDTHSNIFILPFKFFSEWAFGDLWRGYPYILVNGNYYLYNEIPKSYLFINLLYKSPEYFLITYTIFLATFFNSRNFFKKKFPLFNYKLILIISIIVYPFILLFFTPFSIYDGLRHVLWMLPYVCIIPGLAIYYLIENIRYIRVKITLSLLSLFIVFFIFNFFLLTPYQYTYLNALNGKIENRYKKFENDYWGSSTKELINKVDFNKKSPISFATCGINQYVAKYYLKKRGYTNIRFGNSKNSNYIIMTNRVTTNDDSVNKSKKLINCFDKFKGEDAFMVKRSGMILSVIRKIN